MKDIDQSKKTAGEKAAEYLKDGMVLGLGTGSTVKYFLEKLAERIRKESIFVIGIPTSNATEELAKKLGIPLSNLNEHPIIDLDIDGADEVDPGYNLIKGGGGAHTREKIIATASKEFIVIVDESKMVKRLGAFPVAIEVLPLSENFVKKQLELLGGLAKKRDGFKTDNGNIILDAKYNIINPENLEEKLNNIPGVVENGLFAKRRPEKVIIGRTKNTEIKERK